MKQILTIFGAAVFSVSALAIDWVCEPLNEERAVKQKRSLGADLTVQLIPLDERTHQALEAVLASKAKSICYKGKKGGAHLYPMAFIYDVMPGP